MIMKTPSVSILYEQRGIQIEERANARHFFLWAARLHQDSQALEMSAVHAIKLPLLHKTAQVHHHSHLPEMAIGHASQLLPYRTSPPRHSHAAYASHHSTSASLLVRIQAVRSGYVFVASVDTEEPTVDQTFPDQPRVQPGIAP